MKYETWRAENGVADCPMNVVIFLHSEGLIDEDKAKAYLADGEKAAPCEWIKEDAKC